VLPDINGGVTLQKKVLTLNAKGASIQVMDQAGFKALAMPTPEELTALLRAGARRRSALTTCWGARGSTCPIMALKCSIRLSRRIFPGCHWRGLCSVSVAFAQCSFAGAALPEAALPRPGNAILRRRTCPKRTCGTWQDAALGRRS